MRRFVPSLLLLATACSRGPSAVTPHLREPFPKKLSDWHIFTTGMTPNTGVIPYDLNSPLFSDYASKSRTSWMPPGQAARYDPVKTFQFPVGTIVSKSFSFNNQVVETRLLVNTSDGWIPLPYVWNRDRTEAFLEIAPDAQRIAYHHSSGETLDIDYVIPNSNQCKNCHENSKSNAPIGLRARHLNREYAYADGTQANQLAYWTRIGYLTGAPEDPKAVPRLAVWDDPKSGTLDERARAYLDINCAHCHNPDGPGNTSGLNLSAFQNDMVALGECKTPVAAGRGSGNLRFAILPGRPEESILVHRMASVEPKVMMPELGRSAVHREGLQLVRDWISSMRGNCEPRHL